MKLKNYLLVTKKNENDKMSLFAGKSKVLPKKFDSNNLIPLILKLFFEKDHLLKLHVKCSNYHNYQIMVLKPSVLRSIS